MVFRRVIMPNKIFCDIGAFNFYFNYFIFNLLLTLPLPTRI